MQFGKLSRMTLGLAALYGLAFQAQANVVSDSYSGSFAYDVASITDKAKDGVAVTYKSPNQIIFIPMFDASLGTLLDVEILFDTHWAFSSTFRASDPYGTVIGTRGSGKSRTDMRVRLVDPKDALGNNTVERINMASTNNCSAYALSCRDNENLSGNFSGALDWTGGLTLADFIGTGNLKFSMYRNMVANLTSCYANDTCLQRNRNNSWSGDITVNYTYDVPEPATLTLLGLGLAGLGASRMRRRKA